MYGLTELHREEVKKARLVANPGCYPTSVQLPLCPLLEVSYMQSLKLVACAYQEKERGKASIVGCSIGGSVPRVKPRRELWAGSL